MLKYLDTRLAKDRITANCTTASTTSPRIYGGRRLYQDNEDDFRFKL